MFPVAGNEGRILDAAAHVFCLSSSCSGDEREKGRLYQLRKGCGGPNDDSVKSEYGSTEQGTESLSYPQPLRTVPTGPYTAKLVAHTTTRHNRISNEDYS